MTATIGVIILAIITGCIGFVEVDGTHDAFAWWADIFIPTLLGAATVLVSYAAFVASRRATDLAHELERQREKNEEQRASEDRKRRLQDMALEEARALTAWCIVAMERWHWANDDVEKVGEARHGPTLAHTALVMFQQSFVPAAAELFELTDFEVRHYRQYKPDAMYMPDRKHYWPVGARAESEIIDVHVPAFRKARILGRIRNWALDPEGTERSIGRDLTALRANPEEYMDYRRGISVDDLPPLEECERPPTRSAERVAFFEARGLGPSA